MKPLGESEPKVYRIRIYDPLEEDYDETFVIAMSLTDAMQYAADLHDGMFSDDPQGIKSIISAELVSDYDSFLFFTRAAREHIKGEWTFSPTAEAVEE